MDALARYHWPGNIRELQNVIERAVIISTGPALNIDVSDLKFQRPTFRQKKRFSEINKCRTSQCSGGKERQEILKALKESNWVVAGPNGAAAHLAMKRSTLQLRMQKLGITRGSA